MNFTYFKLLGTDEVLQNGNKFINNGNYVTGFNGKN